MVDKIVYIGYALFMFVGAYFGLKKGSQVSLIAGAVSGVLVLVGIWLMSLNLKTGLFFLVGLTGILAIVFLMRLIKTQSFMPSGMLFSVTLIILIFTLVRIWQQSSRV